MTDARTHYLSACAEIASHLEADGFRYARSGPHCTRRAGDWQQRIAFHSSHHNVAQESSCGWR